jgi:hypothetical protein
VTFNQPGATDSATGPQNGSWMAQPGRETKLSRQINRAMKENRTACRARSGRAANGYDLVAGHSLREGFDEYWCHATPPFVRSDAVLRFVTQQLELAKRVFTTGW